MRVCLSFGYIKSILEFCPARCAGEGYYVSDVGHAGHKEHEALEAEAEA